MRLPTQRLGLNYSKLSTFAYDCSEGNLNQGSSFNLCFLFCFHLCLAMCLSVPVRGQNPLTKVPRPAPPQVDSHKARFPPYLISSIEFSPTESNQLVRRIKTLGPHSILHQLSMSLWGDFQWGIHVNFQLKIHVNFQTAEMNTSLSTANWIFNWKGNAATGN